MYYVAAALLTHAILDKRRQPEAVETGLLWRKCTAADKLSLFKVISKKTDV